MRKQDSRTSLRISLDQRKAMDRLVSEGKFESLSHVIRAALTEFLKNA